MGVKTAKIAGHTSLIHEDALVDQISKAEVKGKDPRSLCPECTSQLLINDNESGEVVCKNCGLVVFEKISDRGPEWRSYDILDLTKKRVGSPSSYMMLDKGLSTTLGWKDQDAQGRTLSLQRRTQFYRLRKWQRKAILQETRSHNLTLALSTISMICSNMRLPKNIMEAASLIYRKVVRVGLSKGRSIQGLATASIYLACRKYGVTRSLNEVVQASPRNKDEVAKSYRLIVNSLGEIVPPFIPSHYVSRFTGNLHLPGRAEILAHRILWAAKKGTLTQGRNPSGIAAAVLYITSILLDNQRTQRQVAEIANITEVTIRNRTKEIMNNLEITVKL